MSKLKRGIKNASYLAIGNFISQIITFLGFLFIARILGPEDYGIYVTVGAFVGLFTILTFSGMNKVIIRESSKNLANMSKYLERAIGVKNFFAVLSIIICTIALFITNYDVQTKIFIVIFSSTLLVDSTRSFLESIFQAHEKMKYISIITVVNNLFFTSSAIIVLYQGHGILSLLLLKIFYSTIFLILEYKITKKFVIFKFWQKVEWNNPILKPALIFTALSFFIILTTRIDLVMISFLGTSKDVGIYGIAYNITRQGIVLRNIISTAFFPIFVKIFNKGTMKSRILFKYSLFLGLGLFLLATIGYIFSEPIITFLFGVAYSESGRVFRILVFYIAIVFFSLPFVSACYATNNEKLILKIISVSAIMNVILNYALFLHFGLMGIAYSTLIVFTFSTVAIIVLSYIRMKSQGYLI